MSEHPDTADQTCSDGPQAAILIHAYVPTWQRLRDLEAEVQRLESIALAASSGLAKLTARIVTLERDNKRLHTLLDVALPAKEEP